MAFCKVNKDNPIEVLAAGVILNITGVGGVDAAYDRWIASLGPRSLDNPVFGHSRLTSAMPRLLNVMWVLNVRIF